MTKICLIMLAVATTVGAQANGGLLGLLGGGLGGSASGSASTGGGIGALLENVFKNEQLGSALENLGIGKEDLQSAIGNIETNNQFATILKESHDDCSKPRYRKQATKSRCATAHVGDMIDTKLTGGQATFDKAVDKTKYASLIEVIDMCRVRQENDFYTWADLEVYMKTNPGDTPQTTINQCRALIRTEKSQCTQAAKVVCGMINGEHPACRTTAELRFGALPYEDSCDTISRPLHAKALKEEQERLDQQAKEAEKKRQAERERENLAAARRTTIKPARAPTAAERALGTSDGTSVNANSKTSVSAANRDASLATQLNAEVGNFESAGGVRGRDN